MSKYSHFEMCKKIFGQKYKWNEQKQNYEPYSRTDMWNKMIEQQDKISDLETKLAESEKQIKDAREAGNMAVDSWCKNRRKYEAQIAEMQNKSFILYSMLYETLEKQGCDNVASQIDQMTGWTYDKEVKWLKGNRNYDQLKQQLAESEKSKESYRLQNEQHHLQLLQFYSRLGVEAFGADIHEKALETLMIMKEQLAEKDKEISEYVKIVDDLHKQLSDKCDFCDKTKDQDKISFAVEQLEKAKSFCISAEDNGWCVTHKNWLEIVEYIDNQIKAIKGEK